MSDAQDAEHPRAPEALRDLTETAYNLWRHSPVTAAFLQFIADRAGALKEQFFELWEAGALTKSEHEPNAHPEMVRGRYLELSELHRLSLGEIHNFYGLQVQTQDEEEDSRS